MGLGCHGDCLYLVPWLLRNGEAMRFVHVVVATPAPGVDVKPETGVYDRDVYDPAEAVHHFLEKLSKPRVSYLAAFLAEDGQKVKAWLDAEIAKAKAAKKPELRVVK